MCISHWSYYTCGHEGKSEYPLGIVRCSKVLRSFNKNNVCVPIPEEFHEEDVECPACRSQKGRMQKAKEVSKEKGWREKVAEKKTAGTKRKAEGEGEGAKSKKTTTGNTTTAARNNKRKGREDDEDTGKGTGKKVAKKSGFGRSG